LPTRLYAEESGGLIELLLTALLGALLHEGRRLSNGNHSCTLQCFCEMDGALCQFKFPVTVIAHIMVYMGNGTVYLCGRIPALLGHADSTIELYCGS